MAEETQTDTLTETVEETAEQKPTVTVESLQAELAKLNRQLTNKTQEADRLHKKVQEREDAEKSEMEKARQTLADTQAELTRLKHAEMQRQVAEKIGLPQAFASRIVGETPEAMEDDAKSLLAALPKTKATPPVSPTNPGGNAAPGETYEQRRARIYGINGGAWDTAWMREHGGGVIERPKE